MKNIYKKIRPSYEVHQYLDASNINDYIMGVVKRNVKQKNSFTFSDFFGDSVQKWIVPLKSIYDFYYTQTNDHKYAMTKSARDAGLALKNLLIDNYEENLIIEKIRQRGKYVNKYTIKKRL